jgi:hypothetical protein
MAHLQNGMVSFVGKFIPGSKHDRVCFLTMLIITNLYYVNTKLNEYWSIMAEKGYEGANHHIFSILPTKGIDINNFIRRENKRISSSRIICENYFGRLKFLWGASRNKI